MVAHLLWGQAVGGSSPPSPTQLHERAPGASCTDPTCIDPTCIDRTVADRTGSDELVVRDAVTPP